MPSHRPAQVMASLPVPRATPMAALPMTTLSPRRAPLPQHRSKRPEAGPSRQPRPAVALAAPPAATSAAQALSLTWSELCAGHPSAPAPSVAKQQLHQRTPRTALNLWRQSAPAPRPASALRALPLPLRSRQLVRRRAARSIRLPSRPRGEGRGARAVSQRCPLTALTAPPDIKAIGWTGSLIARSFQVAAFAFGYLLELAPITLPCGEKLAARAYVCASDSRRSAHASLALTQEGPHAGVRARCSNGWTSE